MNATALAVGMFLAEREGLERQDALRLGLLAGALGLGMGPSALLAAVLARREIEARPAAPEPPKPASSLRANPQLSSVAIPVVAADRALPGAPASGDGQPPRSTPET